MYLALVVLKCSKLNSDILETSIKNLLAYSTGETYTVKGEEIVGKKRNFVETIDIQVSVAEG